MPQRTMPIHMKLQSETNQFQLRLETMMNQINVDTILQRITTRNECNHNTYSSGLPKLSMEANTHTQMARNRSRE